MRVTGKARRRVAGVMTCVAATAVAGVVVAGPASAASQDGGWNTGEVAFWYNSSAYGWGSMSDFLNPVSNLGSPVAYKFLSSGAGQGTFVKNNAGAAGNARTDNVTARVYYNSNYDCSVACQNIPADSTPHDLNTALHNNNASWKFI